MLANLLKSSLIVAALTVSSCVSYGELVSFDEADLSQLSPQNIENSMNLKVQPEDLLRITVTSLNMEAAAPFNVDQSRSGGQTGGASQSPEQLELSTGYFVDQEGNIDFPGLGKLYVVGKTLEEIKGQILEELEGFLADPVVNIRFLNFKVTVLGEVNLPGSLRLTNKRISILEAIGNAGDLTLYADRSEVLVIREQDGVRTYGKLNLQDDEIFSSPYYYLQQNDVIYVKPLESRVATIADPASRLISYGTAALSFVAIILAATR
ncbi:polysaccharide export outer membrane protein [Lewinella aquimaris]|uniref:Polysaccharide export outer membrane protein n=1 Tax=Neolewinella aquimaris TaxID=1835722 RepID=A0A840EEL0_9BACT|nr:polysaccharide biosynthesis/export family protein [Neolewinella aquimaris]MBB4080239.1 polysaccharide export outer membrane protein [Neolewinella aquimaris]